MVNKQNKFNGKNYPNNLECQESKLIPRNKYLEAQVLILQKTNQYIEAQDLIPRKQNQYLEVQNFITVKATKSNHKKFQAIVPFKYNKLCNQSTSK